jgi:hypothetical protein
MTLSVVFSAVSLVICGFSFICLMAYLRRRTGARRILEDFEEEVNKLIAGMDAAADRDITLLEDRSATIKAMLETLDRRLAAYARELERREKQEAALEALSPEGGSGASGVRTEGAYAALGRGLRSSLQVNPQEPSAPPSGPTDPPAAASAVTGGGSAEPPGPVGPDAAESPPRPRFVRSATPVRARPTLAEQARELYRNGFSQETIAVRLGATLAEINLALALPDSDK